MSFRDQAIILMDKLTFSVLNSRLKQETNVSKEHFAKRQSNTGDKLNAFGNVPADLFDIQCQL